jgi:rSAM/selenodomain-associated transferase 2
MRLSIVIPVLNESRSLYRLSQNLKVLKENGHELIVVDGGSTDDTVLQAQKFADHVLSTSRGRAVQMNAGAKRAQGDVLVLLHADTKLPDQADRQIEKALANPKRHWGCFHVKLSGDHPLFRMIETFMNLRSRLTGIVTGDKVLFVRRKTFDTVEGFPEIALMEDIAISKRLKKTGRPICLSSRVCTSSRLWERDGIVRTIFKMWRLRLAYFLGAKPESLVREYYGDRR